MSTWLDLRNAIPMKRRKSTKTKAGLSEIILNEQFGRANPKRVMTVKKNIEFKIYSKGMSVPDSKNGYKEVFVHFERPKRLGIVNHCH